MGDPVFTRRKLLAGATAVGLGAAGVIATAGPPFGGGSRTISFWHLFSGGDGERMNQMLDAFAKSDAGIKVEPVTLTWGPPYYTKLQLAAVGGRPPDVAIAHATRLGSLAPAGLVTELTPELLAKHGITPDKFEPTVWKRGQFQGKQYAIPLDTHPFVLYYNTELAKKADLLGEDGRLRSLNGEKEVLDAFAALKKASGQWGVVTEIRGVSLWRLFLTLYGQQNGGPLFSPDGKELAIEDDKAVRALEFMQQLGAGRKVMPTTFDYPASIANFSNATTGSMLQGEWEVTTFQAAKLKFDIAQVPNMLGNRVAQADSHAFVIPKSSRRSQEHLDAALEFVAGMLKSSFTWSQGGHVPAWRPVVTSEKFRKLTPQSHYAAAAESTIEDPLVWFSGAGSDLENEAWGAFLGVMTGGSKPRAGLAQFRAAMQQFLDKPSPV
ncbi:MAG: multiple sugar transport system substrate-binding protein [Solirubrobacteraceae bacterium]|jgi:multiple sugar transport system substrate-binding protein|nr:multiple sugar transport system substrate-binding protein [Solirubrobacteraceae bacterium]